MLTWLTTEFLQGVSSPVLEVNDLVEEECAAGGAGEAGREQVLAVGQERVALRAGEESPPAHVLQEHTTHILEMNVPNQGF